MLNSRIRKSILLLAAILLITFFAASNVHAQAPEATKIRVEITDGGFQCAGGKPTANCLGVQEGLFTIEVEQGQLVELTIVWAHKAYPGEEHIIVLEGYKLETDKLNPSNREATFKFIADKGGTFGFKCDLECDIHDYLQRGRLRVKRTGSNIMAAGYTPTTLNVSLSSPVIAGGEIASLMTTLRDDKGVPVSKAEVRFYLDTDFISTKGKMEIGVAKTDANGAAFFEYKPTLDMPKHTITARFEGLGVYAESQKIVQIELVGEPTPAYSVAPIGTEEVGTWAARAFIFVLAGVWTTYSFVLFQVFAISREGKQDA